MKKRIAFKMLLNEGQKNEYKKRHDEMSAELKKLLKDSGISEYAIFLDEETNILFAFQISNGEQGSQDLGQHDVVKKWWKSLIKIMKVHPDNSPVSIELEEMFYLE